jgi:hypothetical protein
LKRPSSRIPWPSQRPIPCPARLPPSGRGRCLVTVGRSPQCIARQRFPHIGLGQAELPGDLRRLDASPEGGAHGVHLSGRQLNGNRFDPRLVGVSTDTEGFLPRRLFGEYDCLQSIEFLIVKLLDGGRQVFPQNMRPQRSRRRPTSVRWYGRGTGHASRCRREETRCHRPSATAGHMAIMPCSGLGSTTASPGDTDCCAKRDGAVYRRARIAVYVGLLGQLPVRLGLASALCGSLADPVGGLGSVLAGN